MTYSEFISLVKEKQIISAVRNDGKTDRFFVTSTKEICYFKKNSSKFGYMVYEHIFNMYVKFNFKKEKTNIDLIKKEYALINKYKKMAEKATFSNSWIDDCKKLPSFEEYKENTKIVDYGVLYNYHITTGNKIDGKVISLSRIEKIYPRAITKLREAIANKLNIDSIISRAEFAGYEMSISTHSDENGFKAFLSLEYKDCGNGYYYMLINDENFIGYDVD
jgi:hypothetical protein